MFNGNKTIVEALASIESQLGHIRARLESTPETHVMQLVPTGSYWLGVDGASIGHVVSLVQLGVPSNLWEANREHWFRNPGIDFAAVFGTEKDLTINPDIQCGTPTPCAALQAQMDLLATDWSSTFQMYALGELTPGDWSKTPPKLGTNLYAYSAPGSDPMRPRVVFDVDAKDTTKLDRIVWLTDDDALSTFPVQVLTLRYIGNTLPEAGYYYTATR